MKKNIWEKFVLARDHSKCRRCGSQTNNVIAISTIDSEDFSIKNGLVLCDKCENEYHEGLGPCFDWKKIEMYLNEKNQTLRVPILINNEINNNHQYCDEKIYLFNPRDFKVKSKRESEVLRDKIEDVEKELVEFLKEKFLDEKWDYHVTSAPDIKKQWGAIFRQKVENHRTYDESIHNLPNIILDIPTDGKDIVLAFNIEFVGPREMLANHCYSSKFTEQLLVKIKEAKGARISVRKKLIKGRNDLYDWCEELWDDNNLSEIDTSLCTCKYLLDLCQVIKNSIHTKDGWWYETVFLIKYSFSQNEFISRPDIMEDLKKKLLLLAPIIELISRNN